MAKKAIKISLAKGVKNKNFNMKQVNQVQKNETVFLIFRIPIQYPIKK